MVRGILIQEITSKYENTNPSEENPCTAFASVLSTIQPSTTQPSIPAQTVISASRAQFQALRAAFAPETCLFCCVSSVCRVLVDPFPWTWLVPIICHATLASTFVNLTATEFILAENAVNFAAVCTSRAPLPRRTPRYQTKK